MKKANQNQIIQIQTKTNNFVIISHEIAKNKKLSDFAIRLYGYLKSHNENFYISQRVIANYLNISLYKLEKGIKELKQSGFLDIEQKGNQFIYKLYDTTANQEYKINQALENDRLDLTDIETIFKILNNQYVTQETRDKIQKRLKKIIDFNIYDNDNNF